MTTTISQEILDEKRNLSLQENALNVHFLWQYKFMKKRFNLKWAYVLSRDDLLENLGLDIIRLLMRKLQILLEFTSCTNLLKITVNKVT